MLTISEFDGCAPYVVPLNFHAKDVPGLEGVVVLRDSIMGTMVLQNDRVKHVNDRWNASLGAYAEELRDYVAEVDKVLEAEMALEDVFQKLRDEEYELRDAMRAIRADPSMKARYKSASEAWLKECKDVYGVRYRSEAWVAARVTDKEVFEQFMSDASEFMGPARYYLQAVDTAYAYLMRSAVSGLPKPPARSREHVVQEPSLKERMTAALTELSEAEDSNGAVSNDSSASGDGDNVAKSDGHSTPDVAASPPHHTAGTSKAPSGSATKRRRESTSGDRRDKPSRTELFLQRTDNLSTYKDDTLPYTERLRACNALLQALPSTVAKIVPNSVRHCPDMQPDNLRHYIEAVQHALDANSDLEPVWYHLYFNKLPSDIQTAVHQHFAPLPMSLVSFHDVASHIRQTYISSEVLVTVLHKLRTQITFNPKEKGSADKFALAVRMGRDRLRAQYGDAINDTAMFGYINDWMGHGHWMSREFNKAMLGKAITWDNINLALIYCAQHDALHTTNTRDTTQPPSGDLKARNQMDKGSRYHPYSNAGDTRTPLPQTIRQLQATVNSLAAHMTPANPASQGTDSPRDESQPPPYLANINTHTVPPPPSYNRPWSEKFCSFCKFAGKPATLYTTHNTKECRLKDQPDNAEMKTAWASRLTKRHPDNPVNPHSKEQTPHRPGLGSDK